MFSQIRPVAVTVILLAVTVAAPVAAGPDRPWSPEAGPSAQQVEGSLADLQDRIRADRARLERLLEAMFEIEARYAQLQDLQQRRAALRGEMLEHGSIQSASYTNLTRFLRRVQDDPDRLDALHYEIGQSIDTLTELAETVRSERRLLDRIRADVRAENATIENLTTPLGRPLLAQRASQLSGIEGLNDTLVGQAESLAEARRFQSARARYLGSFVEVWRDIDQQKRKLVLARVERELTQTGANVSRRDSSFENQRLLTDVLARHHRARIATVVEFRSLLDALDHDLARLRQRDDPAVRDGVRADIQGLQAEFATVRGLLAEESDAARRLRESLATHEHLQTTRLELLDRQTELVATLHHQTDRERQNRSLTRLGELLTRERDVLAELDEQLTVEQRRARQLYAVFEDVEVDQRGAAYLQVRDRIADLLVSLLDRQRAAIERERVDVVRKQWAVARVGNVWRVQDRLQRLGDLNETMQTEQLEAATTDDRLDDALTVVGWLGVLRAEADGTFAAEAELLGQVLGAIDADAHRPTATPTVPTVDTSVDEPPPAVGPLPVLAFLLAVFATANLLLAWRGDPERLRPGLRKWVARSDGSDDRPPSNAGGSETDGQSPASTDDHSDADAEG